jgi:hypothetical protein
MLRHFRGQRTIKDKIQSKKTFLYSMMMLIDLCKYKNLNIFDSSFRGPIIHICKPFGEATNPAVLFIYWQHGNILHKLLHDKESIQKY